MKKGGALLLCILFVHGTCSVMHGQHRHQPLQLYQPQQQQQQPEPTYLAPAAPKRSFGWLDYAAIAALGGGAAGTYYTEQKLPAAALAALGAGKLWLSRRSAIRAEQIYHNARLLEAIIGNDKNLVRSLLTISQPGYGLTAQPSALITQQMIDIIKDTRLNSFIGKSLLEFALILNKDHGYTNAPAITLLIEHSQVIDRAALNYAYNQDMSDFFEKLIEKSCQLTKTEICSIYFHFLEQSLNDGKKKIFYLLLDKLPDTDAVKNRLTQLLTERLDGSYYDNEALALIKTGARIEKSKSYWAFVPGFGPSSLENRFANLKSYASNHDLVALGLIEEQERRYVKLVEEAQQEEIDIRERAKKSEQELNKELQEKWEKYSATAQQYGAAAATAAQSGAQKIGGAVIGTAGAAKRGAQQAGGAAASAAGFAKKGATQVGAGAFGAAQSGAKKIGGAVIGTAEAAKRGAQQAGSLASEALIKAAEEFERRKQEEIERVREIERLKRLEAERKEKIERAEKEERVRRAERAVLETFKKQEQQQRAISAVEEMLGNKNWSSEDLGK